MIETAELERLSIAARAIEDNGNSMTYHSDRDLDNLEKYIERAIDKLNWSIPDAVSPLFGSKLTEAQKIVQRRHSIKSEKQKAEIFRGALLEARLALGSYAGNLNRIIQQRNEIDDYDGVAETQTY